MKVSYGEGLATHTDPESCVLARKGEGEALTGHVSRSASIGERYSVITAPSVVVTPNLVGSRCAALPLAEDQGVSECQRRAASGRREGTTPTAVLPV